MSQLEAKKITVCTSTLNANPYYNYGSGSDYLSSLFRLVISSPVGKANFALQE